MHNWCQRDGRWVYALRFAICVREVRPTFDDLQLRHVSLELSEKVCLSQIRQSGVLFVG